MLHTHKNLKYLHKKQKESYFSFIAYEKINDEIVDVFGASESFIFRLKKQIEIALEDDETMQDLLKIELNEFDSKEIINTTIDETIISIEKQMGFKLNQKETSLREFYNYINQLKK